MSEDDKRDPTVMFIDLQYDFTREGGACYAPRSSPAFVREVMLPLMEDNGVRYARILSDYRQPRPGDPRDCCRPGEWGFTSEVQEGPNCLGTWMKCMNSPLWTRDGIGDPLSVPGVPRQDPPSFDEWLKGTLGPAPGNVILAGLTLDACVLCVAQELTFRGYRVRTLYEGTDTRSGDPREKDRLIRTPPFSFWSGSIDLNEFKVLMK